MCVRKKDCHSLDQKDELVIIVVGGGGNVIGLDFMHRLFVPRWMVSSLLNHFTEHLLFWHPSEYCRRSTLCQRYSMRAKRHGVHEFILYKLESGAQLIFTHINLQHLRHIDAFEGDLLFIPCHGLAHRIKLSINSHFVSLKGNWFYGVH